MSQNAPFDWSLSSGVTDVSQSAVSRASQVSQVGVQNGASPLRAALREEISVSNRALPEVLTSPHVPPPLSPSPVTSSSTSRADAESDVSVVSPSLHMPSPASQAGTGGTCFTTPDSHSMSPVTPLATLMNDVAHADRLNPLAPPVLVQYQHHREREVTHIYRSYGESTAGLTEQHTPKPLSLFSATVLPSATGTPDNNTDWLVEEANHRLGERGAFSPHSEESTASTVRRSRRVVRFPSSEPLSGSEVAQGTPSMDTSSHLGAADRAPAGVLVRNRQSSPGGHLSAEMPRSPLLVSALGGGGERVSLSLVPSPTGKNLLGTAPSAVGCEQARSASPLWSSSAPSARSGYNRVACKNGVAMPPPARPAEAGQATRPSLDIAQGSYVPPILSPSSMGRHGGAKKDTGGDNEGLPKDSAETDGERENGQFGSPHAVSSSQSWFLTPCSVSGRLTDGHEEPRFGSPRDRPTPAWRMKQRLHERAARVSMKEPPSASFSSQTVWSGRRKRASQTPGIVSPYANCLSWSRRSVERGNVSVLSGLDLDSSYDMLQFTARDSVSCQLPADDEDSLMTSSQSAAAAASFARHYLAHLTARARARPSADADRHGGSGSQAEGPVFPRFSGFAVFGAGANAADATASLVGDTPPRVSPGPTSPTQRTQEPYGRTPLSETLINNEDCPLGRRTAPPAPTVHSRDKTGSPDLPAFAPGSPSPSAQREKHVTVRSPCPKSAATSSGSDKHPTGVSRTAVGPTMHVPSPLDIGEKCFPREDVKTNAADDGDEQEELPETNLMGSGLWASSSHVDAAHGLHDLTASHNPVPSSDDQRVAGRSVKIAPENRQKPERGQHPPAGGTPPRVWPTNASPPPGGHTLSSPLHVDSLNEADLSAFLIKVDGANSVVEDPRIAALSATTRTDAEPSYGLMSFASAASPSASAHALAPQIPTGDRTPQTQSSLNSATTPGRESGDIAVRLQQYVRSNSFTFGAAGDMDGSASTWT